MNVLEKNSDRNNTKLNEMIVSNISTFAEERLTNIKQTTNEAKYIIT